MHGEPNGANVMYFASQHLYSGFQHRKAGIEPKGVRLGHFQIGSVSCISLRKQHCTHHHKSNTIIYEDIHD